jgi:hypothetical protein
MAGNGWGIQLNSCNVSDDEWAMGGQWAGNERAIHLNCRNILSLPFRFRLI